MDMDRLKRISILGCGNMGTVLAKIVGTNVKKLDGFHDEVLLYVHEELVNGVRLVDIINKTHENVHYLPGYRIPDNIVAVDNIIQAVRYSDFILFAQPLQYIRETCLKLVGHIKESAVAISVTKGFGYEATRECFFLMSELIESFLKIKVCVLMGATVAKDMAEEQFSETTIACADLDTAKEVSLFFQTSYLQVSTTTDAQTVELCGALKHIVGCAGGIIDGLDLPMNTKSAVIRLGLMEIIKFAKRFYPTSHLFTFFHSCGIADLIATSCSGETPKVLEEFVKTGANISDLERTMLHGQKLNGPIIAEQVNIFLKANSLEHEFPLFTAVHRICTKQNSPERIIDAVSNHPVHNN